MKLLLRSSIIGITIGSIAYATFLILGLIMTPAFYPYPIHGDALTIKLIWVQRLVFQKMLNLSIITLAGVCIAFCVNRTAKHALTGAAFAAIAYQSLGIAYLIIRWGFAYYKSSHNFLGTLYTSLAFCGGSAFFMSAFLRWRTRKTEQGTAHQRLSERVVENTHHD